MKFKLKELTKLVNNLEHLTQIEMVQKTAYWLQRSHDKLESELSRYNESRVKLERKYGSYKY